MRIIPVILAGGFGKRLYPISNIEKPKQFIPFLTNNISFFQHTISRIRKAFKNKTIIIVCNKNHVSCIKEQLSKLGETNFILITENESKNTFCSLLLVLAYIKQKKIEVDELFISNSDNFIEDDEKFIKNLKTAITVSFLKQKNILFGIQPTNANTNYGYIKISNNEQFNIFDDGVFAKVEKFTEKPDKQKAERFTKSNKYLWNSGNFIFNYNILLKDIQKYQLNSYEKYNKLKLIKINNKTYTPNKFFSNLDNLQIDKTIIEKSKNLLCCKADFDWCDIGSFEVIGQLIIARKIILPLQYSHLLKCNNNFLKTISTL